MSTVDDAASPQAEAPARGRPRSAETDARILDATLALLREGGPQAVTIDGVAQRCGAARTTIYRRYADRTALLEAVLDDLLGEPFPAPDLSMDQKLRGVLDQVERLIEERLGRGAVAAALTDADPEFGTALRQRLDVRLEALKELFRAAKRAGNVAEDVDTDALVGLLVGAYLGEVLRHGRPRPGSQDRLTDLLSRLTRPVR